MLLILEDRPEKRESLLSRYRDRTLSRTILIADSVTKGQYLVQKLLEHEPFELWIDQELIGSFGSDFLNWLIETNVKPTFVLITTQSQIAKNWFIGKCVEENIPHQVWGGAFS